MTEENVDNVVLIVDEMPLKRALVTQFLADWANGLGLTIVSSSLSEVIASKRPLNCRLVVLSIGASDASDPQVIEAHRAVASIGSGPPVVAIGDRPNVENVEEALGAGMAGYIPTSLEAGVAVAALNFVLAGGSYVPPEVLRHDDDHRTLPAAAAPAPFRTERPVPREHNSSSNGGIEGGNRPGSSPSGEPGPEDDGPGGDLTNRQKQVLLCLQRARSNKEIARELDMSEATVKVHVRQVMRKLGASNRTHAAVIAVAPGRMGAVTAIRLTPVQAASIQFSQRAAAEERPALETPVGKADDPGARPISEVTPIWNRCDAKSAEGG